MIAFLETFSRYPHSAAEGLLVRIARHSWDETAMIEEELLNWVNGSRPNRLARRPVSGRRSAALMRGDGLGQHLQNGPIAKLHPSGRLRVGLRRLNRPGRLNERQNVPELNVRYLLNPHVECDDRARVVIRPGRR
jgi:hypothetical protein